MAAEARYNVRQHRTTEFSSRHRPSSWIVRWAQVRPRGRPPRGRRAARLAPLGAARREAFARLRSRCSSRRTRLVWHPRCCRCARVVRQVWPCVCVLAHASTPPRSCSPRASRWRTPRRSRSAPWRCHIPVRQYFLRLASRACSRVRVSQASGRTSTSSRSPRPLRRRFRRRPRKQKCAPAVARRRVSSADPCRAGAKSAASPSSLAREGGCAA